MRRLTAPLSLLALTLAACGEADQPTTSETTNTPTSDPGTDSTGATTMAVPTTGEPTSTTADPTSEPTTTGPTSDSSTTDNTTEGTTEGTTTGDTDGTTGDDPFMCDAEEVEDKVQFTFSKKFATGMVSPQTQASFYNSKNDEVMLMTFDGEARRFSTEGEPLAAPFKVPAEALPSLDGATYDAQLHRALLINQGCRLVEANPSTLEVYSSKQLDFGMQTCAGISVGADNNLYIASDDTQEIVVIDRNAENLVRRIGKLDTLGIDGPDGIALIAGSENFIVIGTNKAIGQVGVMDPLGNFIVAGADIGPGSAFDGAPPNLPDAVLTLCHRSVAWLCDAYDGTCSEYVPTSGVIDACGCLEKPPACENADVPDVTAFTEVGTFATGLSDPPLLQASFYNLVDQEVVIMTFAGDARRFDINGQPLGPVFTVPPEAQPSLDGATYDPTTDRGLLLTQGCTLVEVEPQTLEVLEVREIGFGADVCAGIAVGTDGNLYIASDNTDEILVVSRDTTQEVRRFDTLADGIDGPDGISLIAGSDNFLVIGTEAGDVATAAIFDPMGKAIVQGSDVGGGMPPLANGNETLVDASLTLCGNGHAWVCEAYEDICHDYAPVDGDINACGCILPG